MPCGMRAGNFAINSKRSRWISRAHPPAGCCSGEGKTAPRTMITKINLKNGMDYANYYLFLKYEYLKFLISEFLDSYAGSGNFTENRWGLDLERRFPELPIFLHRFRASVFRITRHEIFVAIFLLPDCSGYGVGTAADPCVFS